MKRGLVREDSRGRQLGTVGKRIGSVGLSGVSFLSHALGRTVVLTY